MFGKKDNRDKEPDPNNRVLHVYFEGKWANHYRVVDGDKETLLYEADMHTKSMNVRSALTNMLIGDVGYHILKSRIDATIHGQALQLKSQHWNREYAFKSPANNNEKMMWKCQSKLDAKEMVLLNSSALPVARYIPTTWAWKKGGKIEFLNNGVGSDVMFDEVVVTALAVTYYRHQQEYTAATSAANSAGASVAIS